MANSRAAVAAVLALGPTTSTGAGRTVSVPPANKVSVQVKGGVGSVKVDGSLEGSVWFPVIAATTFSTAGRMFASTSATFLVTKLRPTLTLQSSTAETSVYLAAGLL
jgi:hypothetical protein